MKILAICQYYHPEPMRFTDICETLVKNGNEVTVLTGIPNYPMGEIYPGYEKKKLQNEWINGVNVIRCFTIPRKKSNFYRFLNYFSYAISASIKVRSLVQDFDVVLVNQQSPVMMAFPAMVYKKRNQKKIAMYCMDLWPASLVAGNLKKDSLAYHFFRIISQVVYKDMDLILVTSRMFIDYLINEFQIQESRIEYLPQYAETHFETYIPVRQDNRKNEYFNFMFAGNVGTAQSVETIIYAANEVREDSRIRWHIVGDGSELKSIKKLTYKLGLESVIFHGRKSLGEMPELYANADAMLVTLISDPIISMTLPGKVQTYMAAAKPIIASANGETSNTIEMAQCGLCVNAGDYEGLANVIRDFCNMEKFETFSANSARYYNQNFRKNIFFEKLERFLLKLVYEQ